MSLAAIVIMCMVWWNVPHVLHKNDGGLPPFGCKGFNGVGRVNACQWISSLSLLGLVGWWTGLQVFVARQETGFISLLSSYPRNVEVIELWSFETQVVTVRTTLFDDQKLDILRTQLSRLLHAVVAKRQGCVPKQYLSADICNGNRVFTVR